MYVHPDFSRSMMRQRVRDLQTAPGRSTAEAPALPEATVIRLCRSSDDAALDRLAILEGAPEPRGRFVVAELSGRVVAALPVAGGSVLADPFVRTAHLHPLLARRASQVRLLECPPRWPSLRRLAQLI